MTATWAQTAMTTAAGVVLAAYGETWSYRTVTSARDAEARTYSNYTTFTAQPVGKVTDQRYLDERGAYVLARRSQIKCLDTVVLAVGDQVKDPAGTIWHIDGLADANANDGTIRYAISDQVPLKGADKNRSGV